MRKSKSPRDNGLKIFLKLGTITAIVNALSIDGYKWAIFNITPTLTLRVPYFR